ncbi:cytochrome c oxidase assembly protein [Devosia algicola]|uniref:Cytochrome c oxidase assembly protein n=1 Tax=Devosia algicola TaxID=3026418 RepID=A0ABY7YLN8_9HYPH|nr:cytochrome c oxidase assembly protein [Devosia algicola]WDR02211.1 cytochrome c oxidase assembly protein [Devosia algicola]
MRSVTAEPAAGRRRVNISLALGGLALATLWFSPLAQLARVAFSAHMLLHLGIVVVAAPLLAFGAASRLPPITGFGNALNWGLLAGLFEMIAVWGWHIPLLHDAAGHSASLFILEQASFLLGGLAVWGVGFSASNRGAIASAAIILFLTFTHMTMFGLMLTLAPNLLYDPDLCRGAFGLDRLSDQHLGGVLMAVGGGIPYLVGTAWAISRVLFVDV